MGIGDWSVGKQNKVLFLRAPGNVILHLCQECDHVCMCQPGSQCVCVCFMFLGEFCCQRKLHVFSKFSSTSFFLFIHFVGFFSGFLAKF